jgi:translation initiation factor 4E
VVGEQFDVGDEICGIVISIRFQEDIISIWNKTAQDREAKMRI